MTTAPFVDRTGQPDVKPVTRDRLDRVARGLSAIAALTMATAAFVGLVVDGLYRDPDGLRHMLRGHDLVILVVVVPLLTWSLIARARGRARLVWLGTLAFATYNYALYVLGSGFNDLFLLHVAILESCAVALVLGVVSTDATRLPHAAQRARRIATGLLMFLALGLGAMWVFNAIRFAATGATPSESELVLPIASIHLGYALDLLLIVPSYVIAAVLLWRGSTWGNVLAPTLLIGGLLQQLTYLSALVSQHRADLPGATAFDPGEPIVILAYTAALALLLRRPRAERRS